ncbi:MAG: 2-oxoacid:acceptor oxidoreductase family protein [Elusimicrobiota bacterium]
MNTRIIISGFGGQGIMFAGTILCHAGMREGRNVTFFPSYGAEIRGGTANCQVIISDEPIGSPIIDRADILISFNRPSYELFSPRINTDGTIFANTSLFEPEQLPGIKLICIPSNNIAEDCGSILSLNMVMLGALIGDHQTVDLESVTACIPDFFTGKKERFREINIKALKAGFDYSKKT